jgi:hypothetical protein
VTVLHDLYAVAWLATWGNNMAWLESLAVAGLAVYFKRDAIGRLTADWRARHHPHNTVLAEIREAAEAARRIAADTYEHHAGRRHPDSPEFAKRKGGSDGH